MRKFLKTVSAFIVALSMGALPLTAEGQHNGGRQSHFSSGQSERPSGQGRPSHNGGNQGGGSHRPGTGATVRGETTVRITAPTIVRTIIRGTVPEETRVTVPEETLVTVPAIIPAIVPAVTVPATGIRLLRHPLPATATTIAIMSPSSATITALSLLRAGLPATTALPSGLSWA